MSREDGHDQIKIKVPLQRGGNLTQGLWEVQGVSTNI